MGTTLSHKDAKNLALAQFAAEKAFVEDGGEHQFTPSTMNEWRGKVIAGDAGTIISYLAIMISCPQYDDYRDDSLVDAILGKYSTSLGELVQMNYESANPI